MKKSVIGLVLIFLSFSTFGEESIYQPIKIFNHDNIVMMSNDYYVPVFAHIVAKEFSGAAMPPETFAVLKPKQNTEIYKVTPIGQSRWTAVWSFSHYFGNPNAPDEGIKKYQAFIKPKNVLGKSKNFRAPIFRSSQPFEIYAAETGIIFNITKNETLKSINLEIYNTNDDTWIDYNSIDSENSNFSIGQLIQKGDLIGKSQKALNSNLYISQIILNRLVFSGDTTSPNYKWLDFEIEDQEALSSQSEIIKNIQPDSVNSVSKNSDITKSISLKSERSNSKVPYLTQVVKYLENIKRYPTSREARLQKPSGIVEVSFEIKRNGDVINIKVLNSSGSALLDNHSFETLKNAHFPPMPSDVNPGETSHRYTTKFNYSLDNIKN